MRTFLKYLKPFILSIIFIIGLLFIQATCDLSLPNYMSDIVNVGISQKGIEKTYPEAIRTNELQKIVLVSDNVSGKNILNHYKLVSKNDNDYVKKYPLLKKESLYVYNGALANNQFQKDLKKAITIASNLDKLAGKNKVDPLASLLMMSPDQKGVILKQADQEIKSIPSAFINQLTVNYIEKEYQAIGIDVDKIQNLYIIKIGAYMLGIALISGLATILVGYVASIIGSKLAKKMRMDLYNKVTSFANAEMNTLTISSLITRTTNDITQVQTMTSMLLRFVFYAPILGIGGVIMALSKAPSMAWIVALAVIVLISVIAVLMIAVMPKFGLIQKLVDKLNLVSKESLTGMLVVRSFNNEKYEEERFDKVNQDLTKTNLFVNRVMSFLMPFMMFVMNGVMLLIVWVGAKQIDNATIQVGDMMAFMQYAMQIIIAFLMTSMMFIIIPRALVSLKRIIEVIDADISVEENNKNKRINITDESILEFKDVYFKYHDANDYILSDIDFTAKSGETIAFIGSTGSGKSTLVNLLPRFADITKGIITINGVDIKDVSLHELRSHIGFVPQKAILFSGTVASNLKFGNEKATKADMEEALKIAQADNFLDEAGLKREISQGGTNVSGGQRQRLSIARALIKKPLIYIFDDSFSALDFKTDAKLRKALKKNTKNSIKLIVAQRISTVMDADQIIVLDEGKIVSKGTHKQLMKTCNVYQEIALSQLSSEEVNNNGR